MVVFLEDVLFQIRAALVHQENGSGFRGKWPRAEMGAQGEERE